MKLILAVVISLVCTASRAETYVWNGYAWQQVQCGGCCPGGGCGGGFCPIQRQPPRQQPEAPIPGEQYENPNQPINPPLPAPPPIQTPTIDTQALKDQQAAIVKEIHDSQTSIEKSLIVIRDKPGCSCDNSRLEAAITALTAENHSLVIAINELKNNQPAPAPVASGAPVSYDIRPHKE